MDERRHLHRPRRARRRQGVRARHRGARPALRRRQSPVGAMIRIKDMPFRVVGVLTSKGGQGMRATRTTSCSSPWTTVAAQAARHHLRERDRPLGGEREAGQQTRSTRSPTCCASATASARATNDDFFIYTQLDIASTAESHEQGHDHAARERRGGVAAGRRHRDHEHHAGLGDRADARDRHPPRDRREAPRHPAAVPGRAAILSLAGGAIGVAIGIGTATPSPQLARWPTQVQPQVVAVALGLRVAGRRVLRLLPGEARRATST